MTPFVSLNNQWILISSLSAKGSALSSPKMWFLKVNTTGLSSPGIQQHGTANVHTTNRSPHWSCLPSLLLSKLCQNIARTVRPDSAVLAFHSVSGRSEFGLLPRSCLVFCYCYNLSIPGATWRTLFWAVLSCPRWCRSKISLMIMTIMSLGMPVLVTWTRSGDELKILL